MSDSSTDRHCLLVLFRPKLTLATAFDWPFKRFRVEQTTYEDVGLGDWTGFYDWLRRGDGEVVGVRYWPATRNESLFDSAQSLAYVKIGTAGSLEIRFVPSDAVDAMRSADQEFLYDAVFRAPNGEWAIAFDTTALRESDLQRLRQLDVTWSTSLISRDT